MSTREISRAVDAAMLRDGRFCFWSNRKFSFLFYTGLTDAQAFHGSRPGNLDTLAEWLRSERLTFCLVSGAKRLSQLRQACPDGFRVIAAEGDCWLVANDVQKSVK